MELKNLNALKEEIDHLKDAAEILDMVYNCFGSHYEFKHFVESHNPSTKSAKIDRYFNFEDSE